MLTIAKQIGTSLQASEKSRRFMEDTIGERLRAAAIAIQNELDPRIDQVRNEQLVLLSRKLGVDQITLWKRTADNIIPVKSSDPSEINDTGAKSWDYWYTAFTQLFELQPVTVSQGQKLTNFWAGPIQYASSNPDQINKWGYYYDGTTDYIINPYINAQTFIDFENNIGTNALVRNLLADNPDILGITGFDPEFFGMPPIIKMKKGKLVRNLDVRDIAFGEYTFRDLENDINNVRYTAKTGEMLTTTEYLNGKHVMKSFISLGAQTKFVVGVSFDLKAIEKSLNHQLFLHSTISLGLVLAAWLASYIIAGFLIRPLRQILRNVNEIAQGKFDKRMAIRSHDELGLLSSRVNTMARNLQTYTGQLKESAAELKSTKEYLESFVNQTWDAIHVTDLHGQVIQINHAFEKMYGWSAEEALNKPQQDIPDDLLREYEDIRGRVLRGESVADHETVRRKKDGQSIDVSITVSPIRNEAGEIVSIAEISRNITARKETEEVIRRSEKLSVVGQLAAGVAHEIRNPLTTLRGFVQLHQKKGSLSDIHLDVMLSELDRINFIVSEFLVLAKPQVSHFQPGYLQHILHDIIMLLDSQASLSNVRFETKFALKVPSLICDTNQLKQVFVNIMKNSIEAMPNGGTITIELNHIPDEQAAAIRIIDNGCGIPEDELPRLGEPFFTKKPSGNGLGLMVCQRIIANHKGHILVSSRLGKGTCVEIWLPMRKN
ncbi:PAS domain S-box protein [Cohnella faecalis]|uniref:histidine kinase n=2 Tax=Cohnella faecalis TaxID=2315694 RepID=A0A398CLQ9_9BACL|nr:PAS domain S-box protein [Cohnella faecalis]